MRGFDALTGRFLDDLDHLRQSIKIILSTRVGTRVERRPFGSRLPELIDSPVTPDRRLAFVAETARALDAWEPRIRLTRVEVTQVTSDGGLWLNLEGVYLHNGSDFRLEGIQVERH